MGEIDPQNAKFPWCLVWAPLPVVSWVAPFIGHVGIGTENGEILDFSGSYLVNVDRFAFGPVARYLQLHTRQRCLPQNITRHTCDHRYRHAELGTAITWDDALRSSMSYFEHTSYNLFTCNSYSFVANCMNRLSYKGSIGWNMINVTALLLIGGQWVDYMSILRSFLPFIIVICIGLFFTGWHFTIGLLSFYIFLVGWYLFNTYCISVLMELERPEQIKGKLKSNLVAINDFVLNDASSDAIL